MFLSSVLREWSGGIELGLFDGEAPSQTPSEIDVSSNVVCFGNARVK